MARVFVKASSQYLEIASAPVTGQPITMSCWINPASATSGRIFRLGSSVFYDQGFTLHNNGDSSIRFYIHFGSNQFIEPGAGGVTPGSWYHVAGVSASANSHAAYLNTSTWGNDATSTAVPDPGHVGTTSVGRLPALGGVDYFDGSLAEPAIWNVALSAPEIAALAAGASPMSLATWPVRYWRLKEDGNFTDLITGSVLTNFGSTWTSDHPPVADPLARPVTAGMFYF